jgi:hypothetical protein
VLSGCHRAASRFNVGRQRSVLPDQALHHTQNGSGGNRVARRLRLQRQVEHPDGLDDVRPQIRGVGLDLR